jgi:alpha-tubulin suppressor-like RCC1 family protein
MPWRGLAPGGGIRRGIADSFVQRALTYPVSEPTQTPTTTERNPMRQLPRVIALALACLFGALPGVATAGSPIGQDAVVRLAAGSYHTCAIVASRGVSCWGLNTNGQLGVGEIGGRRTDPTPVSLPAGREAVAIGAGTSHTCAVLNDGAINCWGYDGRGQLGDGGANTDKSSPSAVVLPAGRKATAVAAGGDHTCAILDDASVACWGSDTDGQLGNGVLETREMSTPSPVDLPAGRTANAIAASGARTCAILDNGTVACWGFFNRPSPVVLTLPAGRLANSVTVGALHVCVVLDSNAAACQGEDYAGQLGNGASAGSQGAFVVVPTPTGRRVLTVAAGAAHTCAALDDASITCWGDDGDGQLGNGEPRQSQQSPVAVALRSGAQPIDVVAGSSHTCAILNDRSAICWGYGAAGQRGDAGGPFQPDAARASLVTALGPRSARVTNLSLSIEQAPTALTVGQTGAPKVRLSNSGLDSATAITVTLTPTLLGVAATSSSGTVAGQTWKIAALAPGDDVQLAVNLTALGAGTGNLTAEITAAAEPDSNSTPGNNLASEDDQKTVSVRISPAAPVVGERPKPEVVTTGRLRPTKLTLAVARTKTRLRLTGTLLIPAGGKCDGTVTSTTRIGKRALVRRATLRGTNAKCTYRLVVVLAVSDRGKRTATTARFAGNSTLSEVRSAVVNRRAIVIRTQSP